MDKGSARAQARRLLQEAVAVESPSYLLAAAIVAAAFSLVNELYFHLSAAANGLHALVVGALLAGSFAVRRVPVVAAPWVVGVVGVVVTSAMLAEVALDPTGEGMAYVLLLLVAVSPFVLETIPVLAFSAAELVVAGFVVVRLDDPFGWLVAVAGALVLGVLIAQARGSAIVRAGRATALAEERAEHDGLTGVLNRAGLERRWPALVAGAARRGERVVAVFVDVDGFKAVNDSLGHARGDAVIAAVANALRECVRSSDLVTRWGGDEFLVVGSGTGHVPDELAARVSERLTGIAGPIGGGRLGVSVGGAAADADPDLFDELVRRADEDMYRRRALRARADQDEPS